MFVFSCPPFFSLLRQVNLGSRIKDWFFLRIVRDFYLGNILRVVLKMLRTTKAASRGVWPEFLASFTKKLTMWIIIMIMINNSYLAEIKYLLTFIQFDNCIYPTTSLSTFSSWRRSPSSAIHCGMALWSLAEEAASVDAESAKLQTDNVKKRVSAAVKLLENVKNKCSS